MYSLSTHLTDLLPLSVQFGLLLSLVTETSKSPCLSPVIHLHPILECSPGRMGVWVNGVWENVEWKFGSLWQSFSTRLVAAVLFFCFKVPPLNRTLLVALHTHTHTLAFPWKQSHAHHVHLGVVCLVIAVISGIILLCHSWVAFSIVSL